MAQKNVKAEMLRVASRQFYKQGYDAASVKDIVEQCGTTAPALYHHFGSKEGLATAYLESAAQEQLERWKPFFALESLPEIVKAWIRMIKNDTKGRDYYGCKIGNFSAQLDLSKGGGPDHARLRAKVREIMESWISGLAARLDQLKQSSKLPPRVNSTDLAIQLLSVYEGGLLLWRATRKPEVIRAMANQLNAICALALKDRGD